jgi:hypothetical protein
MTPAEEGGEGKVLMLKKDAYKPMDACLMCHPGPGPQNSVALKSCLAIRTIGVEFKGHRSVNEPLFFLFLKKNLMTRILIPVVLMLRYHRGKAPTHWTHVCLHTTIYQRFASSCGLVIAFMAFSRGTIGPQIVS